MKMSLILTLMCAIALLLATAAGAIEVLPNANADDLARALVGSNQGVVIRSASLTSVSFGTILPTATFTNASGTYGIGPGIVLSTGDVSKCGDGVSDDLSYSYGTSPDAETNALLAAVTGLSNHYDCTRLDIVFDLLAGYGGIRLDAVFASEEYPRYQYTAYNDGLGVYLNGTNIAKVNHNWVNINNSEVVYLSGTAFNGALAPGGNPLLTFTGALDAGSESNHLTIVIGDASDSLLDTASYLSNLRAVSVPEPASIAFVGLGAGYVIAALRRRVRH